MELLKNIRIFFDLTHPKELFNFGVLTIDIIFSLILLMGGFGIIIALINFSLTRNEYSPDSIIGQWLKLYDRFILGFIHLIVVISLLFSGFFVCSTLANRYNDWEQAKIIEIGQSVAGEKMSQFSPQIKYSVTFTDKVNSYDNKGKPVIVNQDRTEVYNLNLAGSSAKVTIDQINEDSNDFVKQFYQIDFQADYVIINTLGHDDKFIFESYQPSSYNLIQDFRVEQNGKRLVPNNPGSYNFSFPLKNGEKTYFAVKYRAQGGPSWVYEAYNQLLSNFNLTIKANFPNAEYASGIKPTLKKREGESTIFKWEFKDNVAVQNPFGIYTATESISNTGILPRLLFLAPAILLWWLLLLYLSGRPTIRQIIIFSAMFYASILSLTYFSRIMETMVAWLIISVLMLAFTFIMKISSEERISIFACTVTGVIIPLLALIIPSTGLTLSIAALLSVFWLTWQSRNKNLILND